jgi:glycosyltransferase involved in cell wall biosynthesis
VCRFWRHTSCNGGKQQDEVRLAVGITPISVIIPARNEGDRIIQTALSVVLGRSCDFPLELIIVDDASSDGACERIPAAIAAAPEVRLVMHRLEHWSGIPFARNRGAESASFPIYFITDGNTRFPANWDLPIWRHFDRRRALAATILDLETSFCGHGCQLLLPSMGVRWIANAGTNGAYVPVAACTGTVIDRALFHHLGGYDETMPLYGAAEPEFSVRLWLSGYEIVNVPELQIYHRFRPREEHASFCASIGDVLLRNYLRFASYYLPEDMLSRTYEYYAAHYPLEITACVKHLQSSDVWKRRAQLKTGLPLDFHWFARKFAISCS